MNQVLQKEKNTKLRKTETSMGSFLAQIPTFFPQGVHMSRNMNRIWRIFSQHFMLLSFRMGDKAWGVSQD